MLIRDERGIIGDFFLKVILGLGIFAVVAYDAGSILVNYFTLDSGADDVAVVVSTSVGTSGNAAQYTDEEILQLAKAQVNSEDGGVKDARVLREGTMIDDAGIVHIRLRRVADTLIVSRIGPIARWARATADGQAGTT